MKARRRLNIRRSAVRNLLPALELAAREGNLNEASKNLLAAFGAKNITENRSCAQEHQAASKNPFK